VHFVNLTQLVRHPTRVTITMSQDTPSQEEENKTINVKVVSSSGEEVSFKTKLTTKLSKLQGAYANKVGKDVYSIRCAVSPQLLNGLNLLFSFIFSSPRVVVLVDWG